MSNDKQAGASDLELFANWKGYPLPELSSEGRFDEDYLHREFIAFKAGLARAAPAHAPLPAPILLAVGAQPSETAPGLMIVVHIKQGDVITAVYGQFHPADMSSMGTTQLPASLFNPPQGPDMMGGQPIREAVDAAQSRTNATGANDG